MSRNLLCAPKLLSVIALSITISVLSACAGGMNDPWNQPQTSASSSSPAAPGVPAAPAAPAVAQTARAAKVAILLPLSGKGSDTGQAMLNAAQLAIFDLGANNFELIPRDTMGTPDGARDAAQAAMAENAQLILGPVFASDAKAITPLALQKGLGVISFSTDSSVAGGTSFVMGFLPQTQIRQVIDYAASQGMPRIALITPQDMYGDIAASTFDTYIRQRNLMNAGIVRYTGTAPTAEQISQLISKGTAGTKPFDAVLIAASPAQSSAISGQLTQAGLPPAAVKRLGTGLWDQPETARQPNLQGAVYAASTPEMRQKFETRYRETYNEAAPRLATLAYDATALAIVLARSGQNYTRQTLSNPNGFSGIDGIFRFNNEGLVERGLAILEIRNNSSVVVRQAPNSFQSFGG